VDINNGVMMKFFKTICLVIFLNILQNCSPQQNELTIHYHRYDGNYENWTLWTWLDDYTREIESVAVDSFGVVFKMNINDYPESGGVNILPKFKRWENKDEPSRTWNRAIKKEIWIVEADHQIYTEKPETGPRILRAFLDDKDKITAILSSDAPPAGKVALNNGKKINVNHFQKKSPRIYSLHLENPLKIEDFPVKLMLNGFKESNLQIRFYMDSIAYNTNHAQGVKLRKNRAEFNVFAPIARSVKLNIYNSEKGAAEKTVNMNSSETGFWKMVFNENYIGKFYTYSVNNYDEAPTVFHEVIDPYAKAVTKYNGRGVLINDQTPIAQSPHFTLDEAVIYEMHVRDFTIDPSSGVKEKGKFLGFTESGTHYENASTALDHLLELGINTVQLLPIQSFEFDPAVSSYFWGYMPVHFNAPEPWFASKNNDGSAVREFKLLVDALHKKGIKAVMDVVYNHTSESSPHIRYNFNGLSPNYFYRQKIDGAYWNGSGCGNEMRSENEMVRKFIVESLKYWVSEYDVDGFRFDLMGLHDKETMRQIVKELRLLKPHIFIYGEPWTAGETPIEPTLKGSQKNNGYSVFNDHFRDALKGPWYNTDPGYIQKGLNVAAVKKGIMGSIDDFTENPSESINYVAVHDGRTFWDQLHESTKEDTVSQAQLKAMNKLAALILFTSQGTPFIHGGQEMLRTKFGSHNSYNQPDEINKIRWRWKVENNDIFQYYRDLIRLRSLHPIFRKTSANDIKKSLTFMKTNSANCIAYELKKGHSLDLWKRVLVLLNPNHNETLFEIPAGSWNVAVNSETVSFEKYTQINETQIKVQPISGMVLFEK
jgi:pullulanase